MGSPIPTIHFHRRFNKAKPLPIAIIVKERPKYHKRLCQAEARSNGVFIKSTSWAINQTTNVIRKRDKIRPYHSVLREIPF